MIKLVKGIGIDIIEIHRIKKAIRNEKFVKRVFTKSEIQYFETIGNNINTIAGTFAAKEAVLKTLGTGLRGFKWIDIEIVRDDLGKPMVRLYEGAKEVAQKRAINDILISISHSREYAVAQAIGV